MLLIDVREPDETAQGMIPSAVSLPLSQMKEALDPKSPEGDFYKVSDRVFQSRVRGSFTS